jgi:predicted nucleic acid-binding protein
MTGTLVDSNILIDLFTRDAAWYDWSAKALQQCVNTGPTIINPLIYAEVSIRFERREELDRFLPAGIFERESLPWSAAFMAGQAFIAYRRQGGIRTSPLPDFYIGAHAVVRRYRLLTRDARRYRSYFPALELICPPEA